MYQINGTDFAMARGFGRTDHAPPSHGWKSTFGVGRTDHPPHSHGWKSTFGVGRTDHPPKRGNYGMAGMHGEDGVWWHDVVSDVIEFGQQAWWAQNAPRPVPPVIIQQQPAPSAKTDLTPIYIGGGLVAALLVALAIAHAGRGRRKR